MDNKADVGVTEKTDVVVVKAKPVRRIYKGAGRTIHKIPLSILEDPQINEAIAALPQNYNFEIHKTIWRARELKAKRVALQMPEGDIHFKLFLMTVLTTNTFLLPFAGLLMFSLIISDIIERFTDADTVIMGDVS